MKLKDIAIKNEAQIRYKQYRNLLSTLMKESKIPYFANYFQKEPKCLEEYMERYNEYNLIKRIT